MAGEALALATRALARREHSVRGLRERLLRGGVAGDDADEALEELQRVGLLDDGRFARERARVLAGRGKGDLAIRVDLEQAAVGAEEIDAALAELDPEAARAELVVTRRGATLATARLLASRGFDEAVVEALVAQER